RRAANPAGSDLACAKLVDELLEVARQRRAPRHRLAARRMLEAQLRGVQRLAREVDAVARAAAIDGVADERMADVLEMHADLVRAPGLQAAFDQRGAAEALEHAVARARGLAAVRDGHARAHLGVAADRRI